MMMPQHVLGCEFQGHVANMLNGHDARRRPQMIADRVRPAEPRRGHDFLVIHPLAEMASFAFVDNVVFSGDGAEFHVVCHDASNDISQSERIMREPQEVCRAALL